MCFSLLPSFIVALRESYIRNLAQGFRKKDEATSFSSKLCSISQSINHFAETLNPSKVIQGFSVWLSLFIFQHFASVTPSNSHTSTVSISDLDSPPPRQLSPLLPQLPRISRTEERRASSRRSACLSARLLITCNMKVSQHTAATRQPASQPAGFERSALFHIQNVFVCVAPSFPASSLGRRRSGRVSLWSAGRLRCWLRALPPLQLTPEQMRAKDGRRGLELKTCSLGQTKGRQRHILQSRNNLRPLQALCTTCFLIIAVTKHSTVLPEK